MRRIRGLTALPLSLFTALLLAGSALSVPTAAVAAPAPAPAPSNAVAAAACTDVEAIWARGSGQDLSEGQYDRWFEQLNARIKGSVTLGHYELGSAAQGGHQYPAVDVSNVGNGNAIGGYLSSGYALDYGNSVWEGVLEYATYFAARMSQCPDTVFVAGGFSQGAQVIGQTYYLMPTEARNRIAFNALFGDPKLHLPEGEGLWPSACRGGDLSPWRRRIANCDVDNGSLGARKPYLPSGYDQSTGLWCAADDFVCGSSKNPLNTKGHVYNQEGGDIDSAAIEIAELLDPMFPDAAPDDIDPQVFVIATGTTGLDVAFILDSTGSMSGTISGAKSFASSMASTVRGLRGRVALIEYRDAGDAFVAATRSPLDNDITGFQAALDNVSADGGGDTPEAGLAALMQAFNSLDWRPGATKAAIVLTDAPFHNPDVATGATLEDVVARSLEIDPVNVYAVVPSYEVADYEDLTQRTSGKVVVNDGNAEQALLDTFDELENRPVVLLGSPEYFAQPGETIRFDASDSYAPKDAIAGYDWDFDGDGTYDQHTDGPVVSHVYASEAKVNMAVQVTDAVGRLGSMSAPVTVATERANPDAGLVAPPAPLNAAPAAVADATRDVTLTWTPAAGVIAKTWLVYQDGVPLGTVDGGTNTVTVRGVPTDEDHEFSVAGLNADNLLGGQATTRVERVEPVVPPTTPTTPTPTEPGPAPVPGAGPGAPTMRVPAVTFGTRARVRLSAPVSNGLYDVQLRTTKYNKAFTQWKHLSQSSATRVQGPRLAAGVTQCYRSRVSTQQGTSTWSVPVCTARPVDAAKLTGSGWATTRSTKAYSKSLSSARAAGAVLRLRGVRTARIALSYATCSSCGKMVVKVGAKKIATVDTRSKSRKVKTQVLAFKTFKRGTVSVRFVGSGSTVLLDAITAIRQGE